MLRWRSGGASEVGEGPSRGTSVWGLQQWGSSHALGFRWAAVGLASMLVHGSVSCSYDARRSG